MMKYVKITTFSVEMCTCEHPKSESFTINATVT